MARENGELLTPREASALMKNVSESTIRRWCARDGQILGVPVFKVGAAEAHYRIPRGRLMQALGLTEEQTR